MFDTDQLVEARAGKTVAAIFAEDGEQAFRALEREAVGDAAKRPFLAGDDPRAAIERLLAVRRPAYDAAADVTVDTTDRPIEDVVEEIRQRVGRLERERQWKSST